MNCSAVTTHIQLQTTQLAVLLLLIHC